MSPAYVAQRAQTAVSGLRQALKRQYLLPEFEACLAAGSEDPGNQLGVELRPGALKAHAVCHQSFESFAVVPVEPATECEQHLLNGGSAELTGFARYGLAPGHSNEDWQWGAIVRPRGHERVGRMRENAGLAGPGCTRQQGESRLGKATDDPRLGCWLETHLIEGHVRPCSLPERGGRLEGLLIPQAVQGLATHYVVMKSVRGLSLYTLRGRPGPFAAAS